MVHPPSDAVGASLLEMWEARLATHAAYCRTTIVRAYRPPCLPNSKLEAGSGWLCNAACKGRDSARQGQDTSSYVKGGVYVCEYIFETSTRGAM
jgi:hypothetical protein